MAGNGCYSESYDDIDPAIRDLCRALNDTSQVQTRYSCQGHQWLPFLSVSHPPYLCFDASPEVAKVVHAALAAGRHYDATRFLWVVESAWMVQEGAPWPHIEPERLLLRWSIQAPVLHRREALWGVRHRIDHDFAWMSRALPAAIAGVPMEEWLAAPPPPLTLRYALSALRLWLAGDIRWPALKLALRERPIAVCGRGGSFQVDPDFEPNECASKVTSR